MARAFQPIRGQVGRIRATNARGNIHPGYERAVKAQMDAILKEYRRWVDHVKGQGAEVLREALEPTFFKARDIYTPIDSGDLRDSGFLEAGRSSAGPFVAIGFGRGGSPHYAALVHERTDFFHKPPTRSKFLQVALEEDAAEIQSRIAKGYKHVGGFGGAV